MSARELIRQCQAADIRLEARGDRLDVDAPAGAITPALKEALMAHKAELLTLHAMRARLLALARTMGIPRAVVDDLPVEELEATAEQVALAEGHRDGNGDPLVHSLLVFYLRCLAQKAGAGELS